MIDIAIFSKSVFKNLVDENLIFINKYYSGEDSIEAIKELCFDISVTALRNIKVEDSGNVAFERILNSLLNIWNDSATVNQEPDKIRIDFKEVGQLNLNLDSNLWSQFRLMLSSALAVGFYGDIFVEYNSEKGDNCLFVYTLEMEIPQGINPIQVKADLLLAREINVLNSVLPKINSLQNKIRESELLKSADESMNSSDIVLFKKNQELELSNIEMKSQNTLLAEKNTELAFRLMDMEEELSQAKVKIDVFERMSIEENIKFDEEEESVKKRIAELESKINQTENYLNTSNNELQARMSELEDTKNERNIYLIAKESAETESLLLKKQLKYHEDMLKNAELEKDNLLKQISELENLNAQLREDYINKKTHVKKSKDSSATSQNSYGKILNILSGYLGSSSKILLDKALAKAKIAQDNIDSISETEKKALISAIDKAVSIMSVSKDEYDSMMHALRKI